MKFDELGLIPRILDAIKKEGYTQPSPIQEQAIPAALVGKDILGCAQTGTGKTAAFSIPILQYLHNNPIDENLLKLPPSKRARALILTPTRELALQIDESIKAYGRFCKQRICLLIGGVAQKPQELAIKQGVDILVATPGRLLDLVWQGVVDLSNIVLFVLDEADRMLDMGFINDVKRCIEFLPKQKQTMFFTATMPLEIQKLAHSLLNNPLNITVTPVSSTVDKIEQVVYKTDKNSKTDLLIYLIEQLDIKRALIFCRTKHGADRLAQKLHSSKIWASSIHGDKSQGARQNALGGFKTGRLKALVATDIAARGIDIDDLEFVFNYDLPNEPETYVHRIGRTGRAGKNGTAISLCDYDELPYLKDIVKLIKKEIPEESNHPYPMTIFTPRPKPQPFKRFPRLQNQGNHSSTHHTTSHNATHHRKNNRNHSTMNSHPNKNQVTQ